ncbi:MAG: hypothetical protein KGJ84_03320 [Elusimicrobia bacterium]|nr:hypothetical protein [Elusimicrobiota bacterium]
MKKTSKSRWLGLMGPAFLAAAFAGLGARSASAAIGVGAEFEIVATSFTVDNQVNLSSVSYFGTMATPPRDPALATQLTTPGGLYFDGTYYKVWNTNAWVQLATGTVVAGGVTGSGTAGKIPRWTGAGALGDSTIQDDGAGHVGVGAAPTTDLLNVGGTGNATFTNTGSMTLAPTGSVNILGLTVVKSGGVTTLQSASGTIARIK